MKFRELLEQSFSEDKMDVYKFIKKLKGVNSVYISKEITGEVIPFPDKTMKVVFNDKDFNKPVYSIEWN